MNAPPDTDRKSQLHLPTALGCLALQTLFIGMCLYHNAAIHDYSGILSTISFSSIFLATQALIWTIVSTRFVRRSGTATGVWQEGKIPIVLALFCLIEIVVLVCSPALADRLLALGNPLSLSADGTELELVGSIPSNLAADVRSVCANGACVATHSIALHSDGGSIDGAMEGLEALRAVGVKQAVVDGSCESACVALWAGFDKATISPGSVIAIQGVCDPLTGQATTGSQLKNQRLIKLLQTRGFPPAMIAVATACPSTRYYYLSGAEIDQLISGNRQP